jgi:hypothetical protein
MSGRGQKGILLPMALGMLVLINLLLMILMQIVTTDRKIAYNITQSEQAVLAADAGIAWAGQLLAEAAETVGYPLDTFSILLTEVMLEDQIGFRLVSVTTGLNAAGHTVECEGFAHSARKKYRVVFIYEEGTHKVEVLTYGEIYT